MASSIVVGGYPYFSSAEQHFIARGHLKISKPWRGHKVIFKKSYFGREIIFKKKPTIFYPSNTTCILAVYNPVRQILVFSKSSTGLVKENRKIKQLQSVAFQG
jgi:hypothetical protein